jgi:hypothetical protein
MSTPGTLRNAADPTRVTNVTGATTHAQWRSPRLTERWLMGVILSVRLAID